MGVKQAFVPLRTCPDPTHRPVPPRSRRASNPNVTTA